MGLVGDAGGVVGIIELGGVVDGAGDVDMDVDGFGFAMVIRPGRGVWPCCTAAKPWVFPAPSA